MSGVKAYAGDEGPLLGWGGWLCLAVRIPGESTLKARGEQGTFLNDTTNEKVGVTVFPEVCLVMAGRTGQGSGKNEEGGRDLTSGSRWALILEVT